MVRLPTIQGMIRREHGKWVLRTKDGSKVLGTHDTRAEAEAQEAAVQASKHARVIGFLPDGTALRA